LKDLIYDKYNKSNKRRRYDLMPKTVEAFLQKEVFMMITKIDTEKCIGCGICAKTCPLDVIRVNTEKKAFIAYPEDCMTCFICEMNCPKGAIYVHPFKELLPRSLPNCY